MDLQYVGGTYGGNRKPTPFICLILKMLQIQPEKEIIIELIKNEEYNRTAANVNKERRVKAAKDKAEKQRKERSKSRNEPETYDLQENGYRYGKNDGFSEEESV